MTVSGGPEHEEPTVRAVFRVEVDLDQGFADMSGPKPAPAQLVNLGRRLVQLGELLIARGQGAADVCAELEGPSLCPDCGRVSADCPCGVAADLDTWSMPRTEPTIPVRASVAFAWADATKRNTNGRRAIVNALLDDIEAHRPPPPMPDIEWRAGTRVQRRGADGQGVGPVYICRPGAGLLVDIVGGCDVTTSVIRKENHDPTGLYLGPMHLLRGSEWRLVSSAVSL